MFAVKMEDSVLPDLYNVGRMSSSTVGVVSVSMLAVITCIIRTKSVCSGSWRDWIGIYQEERDYMEMRLARRIMEVHAAVSFRDSEEIGWGKNAASYTVRVSIGRNNVGVLSGLWSGLWTG